MSTEASLRVARMGMRDIQKHLDSGRPDLAKAKAVEVNAVLDRVIADVTPKKDAAA